MTPLQYAVLTAFAHVLPAGPERQAIENATTTGKPAPSAGRVAVTLAEQGELLEKGRITEFGRTVARTYLVRLRIRR